MQRLANCVQQQRSKLRKAQQALAAVMKQQAPQKQQQQQQGVTAPLLQPATPHAAKAAAADAGSTGAAAAAAADTPGDDTDVVKAAARAAAAAAAAEIQRLEKLQRKADSDFSEKSRDAKMAVDKYSAVVVAKYSSQQTSAVRPGDLESSLQDEVQEYKEKLQHGLRAQYEQVSLLVQQCSMYMSNNKACLAPSGLSRARFSGTCPSLTACLFVL
jgi:hypothetical protein